MHGTDPDIESARSARAPDAADRAIRVMHVVDVLALAGLEYGVIKQVNALDRARFSPSICALRHQSEETRSVLSPRVPVHELHHTPGERWRLIVRLAALLRREGVDVAHSHNWATYYPTVLASRLAGVPIVVHGEHGRETAEPSNQRMRIKRLLAVGVDRFVAVSSDIARELHDAWKLPLERVKPIANGVDLTRFRGDRSGAPLRPEEFGFPPEARVAISVGGIRPVKDHATLLRAFATVVAALPTARLLIVGTDYGRGLKEELVRLANALGIADSVHFTGIRNDTPRLLSLASLYVNTSVFEGMSNAILEAMAAGRPVIATSVGGNGELVVDGLTGYLVPPGDVAAVAGRITEVLGSPGIAARLGEAGRSRVTRRHRMQRMIDEYENLYSDLWIRRRLGRRGGGVSWSRKIAARGAVATWALLAGERRRGPTLCVLRYRRVLPVSQALAHPFPAFVTPRDLFERQIAHLRRRYTVLPMEDALRLLAEGALPARSVTVMIEDGYRDAYEEAWPLLRRYEVPATIFLSPALLDPPRRPRPEDAPSPMMTWDDARDMVREGIACGGRASADAGSGDPARRGAFSDAPRNVERLSAELGIPIRWLACQGTGPDDPAHTPLARAGIEAVMTEEHGCNTPGTPYLCLRTIDASTLGGGPDFDPAVFDAELAQPHRLTPRARTPRREAGTIA